MTRRARSPRLVRIYYSDDADAILSLDYLSVITNAKVTLRCGPPIPRERKRRDSRRFSRDGVGRVKGGDAGGAGSKACAQSGSLRPGQGTDEARNSELASRLATNPNWSWGGVTPFVFEPGGALSTPWGPGEWRTKNKSNDGAAESTSRVPSPGCRE